MWALLACSIVALAVILERCCFWARLSLKRDEAIAARVLQDASEGKPWQGGAPKGIITAMLRAGLSVREEDCGKAMEIIALESLARMRKGMNILDTIITAAPMLGIMGTVLGIITSFDMLGAAGASEPRAASGLGIAVVTIFPYNYFNFRIDNAQDILEVYGSRLELIRTRAEEE